MEGGFDGGVEKVEYEVQSSLVVLPEFASITLPNPQLPQKVSSSPLPLLSPSSSSLPTLSPTLSPTHTHTHTHHYTISKMVVYDTLIKVH